MATTNPRKATRNPRAKSLIKHQEYLTFEQLLNDANDSLAAMVASLLLSQQTIGGHSDQEALFGDVYGNDFREAKAFNFKLSRAATELKAAEQHLSYMAIPYAVNIYNEYLVAAVEILAINGTATPAKPAHKMMLGELRTHLRNKCGVQFPSHADELLTLIQAVRNRIIHYGGTADQPLVNTLSGLTKKAVQVWEQVSHRPFPTIAVPDRLRLGVREATAAMAVVRQLGTALNHALAQRVTSKTWADLAVRDYRSKYSSNWLSYDAERRLDTLLGYSEKFFAPVHLSAAALKAAIKRAK